MYTENINNKIFSNNNIGSQKYPDTLQIATTNTLPVASIDNQPLTVPLNTIDILSSSSNDSDLTNVKVYNMLSIIITENMDFDQFYYLLEKNSDKWVIARRPDWLYCNQTL